MAEPKLRGYLKEHIESLNLSPFKWVLELVALRRFMIAVAISTQDSSDLL